jgi:mannose/cellobiose epimerase-like protein (N-acyl-D-glucosamine 2-epimerase family)
VNPHRHPWTLRNQIRDVLVASREAIDGRYGGYALQTDERDGHTYDQRTRHLVGTCRGIYNFAVGARTGGPDWCRPAAEHGLTFLREAHHDPGNGGFDWLLSGRETEDATRYAYGHAFAVLAGAAARRAGIDDRGLLADALGTIEERFWREDDGLLVAERPGDWSDTADYRGQNANMHACEAYLEAHAATGDPEHLDRAERIAERLVREVSGGYEDGLVWEHYTPEWERDADYHREKPDDQFRPWGFQPGHQVEWAKLLLLLHDRRPEAWMVERAEELFEWATTTGWDGERGGFYYGVDFEGEPINPDKYSWTVAEGIGAATLLAERTGEPAYAEWYDRLWAYAREHLINPKYGTWYARLSPDNTYEGAPRGPVVEPGYHPLTNALTAMETLDAAGSGAFT